MPTVKVKGMKKTFPYNAVGKAQADSFAKMNKGNRSKQGIRNNIFIKDLINTRNMDSLKFNNY